MTGSYLSGGKKGLPRFTWSVYVYPFFSLSGACFIFAETKTNLSRGQLYTGLGKVQEEPRSYLKSSTEIIYTKPTA